MIRRRLLVASAAALVAGTASILALAAASDAWLRDGAATLLALAAVFLAQPLYVLTRRTTPPKDRP